MHCIECCWADRSYSRLGHGRTYRLELLLKSLDLLQGLQVQERCTCNARRFSSSIQLVEEEGVAGAG